MVRLRQASVLIGCRSAEISVPSFLKREMAMPYEAFPPAMQMGTAEFAQIGPESKRRRPAEG
jgi:hypothetical protein